MPRRRAGKGQRQRTLTGHWSWSNIFSVWRSTYNNTKTIPQHRAERLELRWGSPRQYRSHRGGWFGGWTLVALGITLHHCQVRILYFLRGAGGARRERNEGS